MTSEEIKSLGAPNSSGITSTPLASNPIFWLKEIAYQLAVMNEYKPIELQRQSEVLNS